MSLMKIDFQAKTPLSNICDTFRMTTAVPACWVGLTYFVNKTDFLSSWWFSWDAFLKRDWCIECSFKIWVSLCEFKLKYNFGQMQLVKIIYFYIPEGNKQKSTILVNSDFGHFLEKLSKCQLVRELRGQIFSLGTVSSSL